MKSKKVYLSTYDQNIIYVIMAHSNYWNVTDYTKFALESIGQILELKWEEVFELFKDTYFFIEAVTKMNLNNSKDPYETPDFMIDVTNQVHEWSMFMGSERENEVPGDVRDILRLFEKLKQSGFIKLKNIEIDFDDDTFDDYIPSTDYFESFVANDDDAPEFDE